MRFKILFLALIILISCKKEIDFPDTKIIGHAASGLNNPSSVFEDNSREAIEMSLEMSGCEGVEIDVQLSASGKLWLFHDPDLSKKTRESGCIGSKTDPELSSISYKSIHHEKLLALADLPFERCKGKTVMLDLRHYDYCKNQLVDVQPFLDELSAIPQFNDGSIEMMVLLSNPDWAVYFQATPFEVIYCPINMDDSKTILQDFPFDGIIIRNSEISKDQVSELKSAGKKVIIFEVRSPRGIKSAFKKQPHYLVTDDLRATIIEKY